MTHDLMLIRLHRPTILFLSHCHFAGWLWRAQPDPDRDQVRPVQTVVPSPKSSAESFDPPEDNPLMSLATTERVCGGSAENVHRSPVTQAGKQPSYYRRFAVVASLTPGGPLPAVSVLSRSSSRSRQGDGDSSAVERACGAAVYVLQPPRLHGAVLAAVGARVRAGLEVLGVCSDNPELTPRVTSIGLSELRGRPCAQ